MRRARHFVCVAAWLACSALAAASPYRGVVTFGGLPLPGATITATQGTTTKTAVSDADGAFQFDDLPDGKWTIDIQMQTFVPVHTDVTTAPSVPAAAYELKLLSPDQIQASAQVAKPAAEATSAPAAAQGQQPQQPQGKKPAASNAQASAPTEIPKAPEENEQSADGLLVQGSVNNAATSQYATNAAFGNTRSGNRGLYTGGFQVLESNSALNAQSYNLSGVAIPKPSFNLFTGTASLFGPIKIPHILPRGPNFSLIYQWTRNSTEVIQTGLVPTQAEQSGNLAGLTNSLGQPITVYQPGTNSPYTNNQIPVSAQATALLKLYPLPNIADVARYNYEAPTLSNTHQDSLQSRFDHGLGRKDQFNGRFAFQSTRSDSVNLFGFVDHSGSLGMNTNIQWTHRLKPRVILFTNFTFGRSRTELTPNFANRVNVSGAAGIAGNDQTAANWGPPALGFGDGTSGLSDGNSSFNRNRNDDVAVSTLIFHGKHNITAGAEYNKREYNYDFQQAPRGNFTFTGAATEGACTNPTICGSALADFLIGTPDASSIAFGNANKYFREPVYDAYIDDDFRVLPILTINAGLRWDYSAPISELFGNLVNLDVASGFTQVGYVAGRSDVGTVGGVGNVADVGTVTGNHYPASLMNPERRMFEPKIGATWRPIPASTVVIKAGYGLYPDSSVYQNIVLSMAQQYPLSKSLSVQNSTACPLTLANGFTPCASVTQDTFGIDPNFRIGYLQAWQLSVQRDMPFALQMTATYSGSKGTHSPQEILPNSYPLGSANPCPSCPAGFAYETSNGDSIRQAGILQLRRRLRSGFAANLTYTFSKSIDDAAYLGGAGHATASGSGAAQSPSLSSPSPSIAQNWLNPRAERSLSNFDQRQLLNLTAQYTSGQGLEGGSLLGGWRGRALKEWTVTGNMTYGTGSPETPSYPAIVPGTGFSNIIRPNLTGVSIYNPGSNSVAGAHLNAAAYSEPIGGWGTAGRNSIEGPDQFTLQTQMNRTFRPHGKWYLDVSVNATNVLNHVSFTNWITSVTSEQFGLPASAGGMRSLQTSFYLRWQ
jgi:trimeric autotransporter adhesin